MHYTSSEAAKTGEPFRTGSRRSGRFGRINPINEEMRTTRRTLRKGTKMKINSKDFRVRPGEKVKLRDRPTIVKPWMARGIITTERGSGRSEEHTSELQSL